MRQGFTDYTRNMNFVDVKIRRNGRSLADSTQSFSTPSPSAAFTASLSRVTLSADALKILIIVSAALRSGNSVIDLCC